MDTSTMLSQFPCITYSALKALSATVTTGLKIPKKCRAACFELARLRAGHSKVGEELCT